MSETLPTPTSDATELVTSNDNASVPRRFGRYQIEQVTGKGAMGWVVLARDLTLQRPVALKLFHVAGSEEGQRKVKKRYVDEARAAAALVHPYILQIYEVGLFEGWVFIAMEVLLGGDLRDRVRSRGPMGWHEACTLIQQAADGLAYAHQQGMIHRDIKPANLMTTARGDCKVVDFGLTTRIDAPIGEPGAGTPNYQSPESARGLNGPQNDVWGLAASLWFLLTGLPPFALDTPKDVLKIHDGLDLPDLRTLRPDVPEPVVRVIEQALTKNPGERFHLAEDFGRVLKLAVEHATQGTPDPMPQAFQRPVNPDLVELASAAGGFDATGSSQSRSRSISHSHRPHRRPTGTTPVWLYVLIAFLLLSALIGTALILMQDSGGPGRSGKTGGDGQTPSRSATSDRDTPGNQPGGRATDGQNIPGAMVLAPDAADATGDPEIDLSPGQARTPDEQADHLTEQFGADNDGLTDSIGDIEITASSAASDSPPGLAIDGDRSTAWQSDSKGWGRNTLTLDLGDAVMLEAVTVFWGDPLPKQVVIMVSMDGERWKTFSRLQAVEDREDVHRLPFAEEARYIRIETRGEPAGEPDIRVREVDLLYE